MKTYRLTLTEKNGNGKTYCVYTKAETKEGAERYFEENLSRFNNLVKITEKK